MFEKDVFLSFTVRKIVFASGDLVFSFFFLRIFKSLCPSSFACAQTNTAAHTCAMFHGVLESDVIIMMVISEFVNSCYSHLCS